VSQVAIVARVTVKEGKTEQYLAAFTPLPEQARKEPGTLLDALHRSKDDPHVFWTTEIYADEAAFAAHGASDIHAAARWLPNLPLGPTSCTSMHSRASWTAFACPSSTCTTLALPSG